MLIDENTPDKELIFTKDKAIDTIVENSKLSRSDTFALLSDIVEAEHELTLREV